MRKNPTVRSHPFPPQKNGQFMYKFNTLHKRGTYNLCAFTHDTHLLLVHSLGGEGEAHGNGGEEPLGHVGHDDADHEHQVGDELCADDEAEGEEDDAEENGDSRDDLRVETTWMRGGGGVEKMVREFMTIERGR